MTKMIQNADEVMTPDPKATPDAAEMEAVAVLTEEHVNYDKNDNDDDDDVDVGGYFHFDDDDDNDDDGTDTTHRHGEDSEIDVLYSRLSTYEAKVDKERFREFEEILADCDEVLKESDRQLNSLDSIRNIISLKPPESDEDDDGSDGDDDDDNDGDDDDNGVDNNYNNNNEEEDIRNSSDDNYDHHHKNDDDHYSDAATAAADDDDDDGDDRPNLDVGNPSDAAATATNTSDDSQDMMTRTPAIADLAKDLTATTGQTATEEVPPEQGDVPVETSTSLKKKENEKKKKKKRSKLCASLRKQMLETSGYYDNLISRQAKVTEESKRIPGKDGGGSVDDEEEKEWQEKVTAFEREKSICEQEKLTKIEDVRKWTEDHESEVKADLIDQQKLLDDLSAQLLELKEQLETSKQDHLQATQTKLRASAATRIQRAYRSFRTRCRRAKPVQQVATLQRSQAIGEMEVVGEELGVGMVAGEEQRKEEKETERNRSVKVEGEEGVSELQKRKEEEEYERRNRRTLKEEEKNKREGGKEVKKEEKREGQREERSRRKSKGEEVNMCKLEVEGERRMLKKEEEEESKRSRECKERNGGKVEEKKNRCLKKEEEEAEVKGSEKWQVVEEKGRVGRRGDGESVGRKKDSRWTGNEGDSETNEENWKKNLIENERRGLNEGLGKKVRRMSEDGMRKDEEKERLKEFEGEKKAKECDVIENLTENERRETNEVSGKKVRRMSEDRMRKDEEKERLKEFEGEKSAKEFDVIESLTENERREMNEVSGKKVRRMSEELMRKEEVKESLKEIEGEKRAKECDMIESSTENKRREMNEVSGKKVSRMSEELMRKEEVKESLKEIEGEKRAKECDMIESLTVSERREMNEDLGKKLKDVSEEVMRKEEVKEIELENRMMNENGKGNLNERDRKMLKEVSLEGNRRKSEEGMKKEILMESVMQNRRKKKGEIEILNENDGKKLGEISGGKTKRMSEEGERNEEETKRLKEFEGEKKMKKQDGKENLNEKDRKKLREVSGGEIRRMSKEVLKKEEEVRKSFIDMEVENKMKEQQGKECLNEKEKFREISIEEIRRMNEEIARKEKGMKKLKEREQESKMKEQDEKKNLIENERNELNESLGKKMKGRGEEGMRKGEEKKRLKGFDGESKRKEKEEEVNLNEKDRKMLSEVSVKETRRMSEEEVRKEERKESLVKKEMENRMKEQNWKENLNEKDKKMSREVSGKKTGRMSGEEGIKRSTEEGAKGMKDIEGKSKMKEQERKENLNENDSKTLREVLGKEIKGMNGEANRKEGKTVKDIEGKSNVKEKDGETNLIESESRDLNEDLGKKSRKKSKEGMRKEEESERVVEKGLDSREKEHDGKENLNEKDRRMLKEVPGKETRRMSEEGVRKGKEKLMEEGQKMASKRVEGENAKTEKNQKKNSNEMVRNELKDVTGTKTGRMSVDSVRNERDGKKSKADEEKTERKKNGENGSNGNYGEGTLIDVEKNELKDVVGRKTTRTSAEGARLGKKLVDTTVSEAEETKSPTSEIAKDCGESFSVGNSSQSAANGIKGLQKRLQQRRLEWMSCCGCWRQKHEDGGATVGSSEEQCSRQQPTRRRPPSRKRMPTPLPVAVLLPPSSTETSLQQLTTVQLQDLPGCSLSTLGQCTNLQCLSLVNCHILSLDGLQPCSHLKHINVQNNVIEYIDLKGMTSVQYIDLSRNKLTAVHGFDGLTNLVWLNLAHNNITKLDAGLEHLTQLHSLNLSDNQLVSISSFRRSQVALQSLDLSGNQLQQITDLASLELLRTLDVSRNNLSQIPILSNQVLLSDLQLSDNNLASVMSLGTAWCPLLRQLNLGQNRLTCLPQMDHTQQLESLDVSDNQLTDIHDVIGCMAACSSLTDVYLTGNPCSEEEGFRLKLETCLPSLKSINGDQVGRSGTAVDSVSSSTAVDSVSSRTAVDSISSVVSADSEWKQVDDVYKSQVKMFCNAEESLREKIKHKTNPLDVSSLCDTWVEHCHTTHTMALECRYWHEHGKPFDSTPPSPGIETSISGNTDSVTDDFDRIHVKSTTQETSPIVSSLGTTPVTNTTPLPLSPVEASDVINVSNTNDKNRRKTVAATRIQAAWRGFSLRNKVKAALCYAQMAYDEDESEFGEDIDLDAFDMAEADLEKNWSPPVAPEVPKRYPVIGRSSLDYGIVDRATPTTSPAHCDADPSAVTSVRPSSSSRMGLRTPTSPTKARPAPSRTPLHYQVQTLLQNATLLSSPTTVRQPLPPAPPPSFSMTPASASSSLLAAALPPRPPPAPRRQAWISPRSLARSSKRAAGMKDRNWRQPESELESQSPDLSSLSQWSDSNQQTASSGNMSRLTDSQICEEWGFHDPKTAKVMRERAKKMKLNAERRQKLKKLDPQQRFVLFQKLHVLPNVRTSPSKTQQLQQQQQQQQQQKRDYLLQSHHLQLDLPSSSSSLVLPANSTEDENQVKECRTYLWVHTQVPNLCRNDSQLSSGDLVSSKPNRNLEYGQSYTQLSSMAPVDLRGVTSANRGRAVDPSDTGSYTGSSHTQSTLSTTKAKQVQLPPISHSPPLEPRQNPGQPQHHQYHPHPQHHSSNQKQVRAVERSTGWGGGRRRNMQK